MPASGTEPAVRAAFAEQARWADRLGSPFTALLCATLAARLDREQAVGRRLLDWAGRPDAGGDALALRLCGALHALVRCGEAPALAACYPPNPLPEPDDLWVAVRAALSSHGDWLLPWLDSPPQTNEVGRSAVLIAGLLVLASRYPQPVELLELGASGGLNLNLDRYRYDLGGLLVGEPESPLLLTPEWKGSKPPAGRLIVAARAGVDLRPIDLRRDRERLLAYVWPDQPARIAQLTKALEIAAVHPPRVDRGDAAAWLEKRLAEPRQSGRARVVLHSVAFQYFAPPAQARIAAMIEAAGAHADAHSPLAWLRFEKRDDEDSYSLRLRDWPGGEDRLLAWSHPHGRSIRWLEA